MPDKPKASEPPASEGKGALRAAADLLPSGTDLAKAVDPWGVREIFSRPSRLLWINFLAGIVRGVGFTLGVGLIGGLILSLTVKVLRSTVNVPVIGQYVAEIVSNTQRQIKVQSLPNSPAARKAAADAERAKQAAGAPPPVPNKRLRDE